MRYIFLHGLGQSPSAWAKTLDLAGIEGTTCPDLASWIRGRKTLLSNPVSSPRKILRNNR